MKLLVHMSLSDHKVRDKLLPLSMIKEIKSIDVVRSHFGPPINKVKYICPQQTNRWQMYFNRIRLLKKMLRGVHYDFTITYLFFPHGLATLMANKKMGVPSILSLIAGPVEFLSLFPAVDRMKYSEPLPQRRFSKSLLVSCMRQFNKITVTGTFTKSALINSGLEESKISIIRNVVDEYKFYPTAVKKDFDILILSRFSKVKNLKTAIAAIAYIAERFPDLRVACVGEGPEGNCLKVLVRKLRLKNKIKFFKLTHTPEIFFRRSRTFLLSSLREGFPATVVESLACGTPVITSKCGDVADLIIDGWNGFIVKNSKDIGTYAEKILKVLSNPELEKTLSANAKSIVNQCSMKATSETWRTVLGL